MGEGCVLCQAVAGEIDLPGSILWEDARVIAFHVPPTEANPLPSVGQCLVVVRRHAQLQDFTDQEMESVTRACRALLDALRADGVEGAGLDPVGPTSGFDHHSVVVGSGQGFPDEITEFVNRLRAHL